MLSRKGADSELRDGINNGSLPLVTMNSAKSLHHHFNHAETYRQNILNCDIVEVIVVVVNDPVYVYNRQISGIPRFQ